MSLAKPQIALPKFCNAQTRKRRERLPLAVYVLGFAIFAQGTSELMLTGLLPELAHDLHVSVPRAGLLISGFAVGMLVGAPVLAVASRRWPRRFSLAAFLLIFASTQCVGALAPTYAVLLASRIVGAFVYAGFWAVAGAATVDLVPEGARGRAMAVVAGGLPVATVLGLPGGTLIGQLAGWRAAFWLVAALSIAALLGVLATVPEGRRSERPERGSARAGVGRELRQMADPRLLSAYATTALAWGATIVTFSYLAPLLTDDAGLARHWVPAVLGLYGVAALAGIVLGGRAADRRPLATLYLGIGGVVACSAALALSARYAIVAILLIGALGFFAYAINPILNSRPFSLVSAPPTLVAAFNVVAFNLGISVAPWLGGRAIDAGLGYASTAWIAAILGTAAILVSAARSRSRGAEKEETSPSAGARRSARHQVDPAR